MRFSRKKQLHKILFEPQFFIGKDRRFNNLNGLRTNLLWASFQFLCIYSGTLYRSPDPTFGVLVFFLLPLPIIDNPLNFLILERFLSERIVRNVLVVHRLLWQDRKLQLETLEEHLLQGRLKCSYDLTRHQKEKHKRFLRHISQAQKQVITLQVEKLKNSQVRNLIKLLHENEKLIIKKKRRSSSGSQRYYTSGERLSLRTPYSIPLCTKNSCLNLNEELLSSLRIRL